MSTVPLVQVILRGCGIDVHKGVVVATISGEGLKTETRSYKTFSSSLTELKEWLLSNGITHVTMESTGVYWKPVYKVLGCPVMKVWIVNARHIKYVPGHKTDKKDSTWICKLLLTDLLKPSYIPEREQRELRDLTRYRNKLIQHVASEKNRIVRILEDCNIKLSCVMSHLDGVVATKLIDMLIEKGHVTMDEIACVYHKRLEASPELLYQACEGFIEPHHTYMLQTIRKDMAQTEAIIADLTYRIKVVLSSYKNVIELLQRVPGLSRKTVEGLIAEIGVDMEAFPTEKHPASWVGMCPGNNESAGKKKRKNHAWQQTVESRPYGSCLGGNSYQEYLLQRTLSPVGSPQGQEKSFDSSRTLDPEIGMAYT